MKKQLFSSLATTIAFVTISLEVDAQPSGAQDPVVEIYNKDKDSIQVNIVDPSSLVEKNIVAYVSPGKQWNSGPRVIDMNNTLLIEVLKQNKLVSKYQISAPGKTKYLTWNPAKTPSLYPETGPLMGFMGKTESGLPLKNNVSSSQITQIMKTQKQQTEYGTALINIKSTDGRKILIPVKFDRTKHTCTLNDIKDSASQIFKLEPNKFDIIFNGKPLPENRTFPIDEFTKSQVLFLVEKK